MSTHLRRCNGCADCIPEHLRGHGEPPPVDNRYVAPGCEQFLLPVLPTDVETREQLPIAEGFLDYFPLAVAAVAHCSLAANEQHNPGQPMHWARNKSTKHRDKIAKHLIDAGTFDTDGIRHSTKLAWRALALLQKELEDDGGRPGRASRF